MMWELHHKESCALKKHTCFWTVVLEKTLESPLDCKEIYPVNPKGNQSWIFTDAEAETPILWPPDAKNWLIGKDPDTEKDWRQEEKGVAEDEMVGKHYWPHGHEFEQTSGDSGDISHLTNWVQIYPLGNLFPSVLPISVNSHSLLPAVQVKSGVTLDQDLSRSMSNP